MKTIYNVAVLMESQAQCDRMKQLCLDNGLTIWDGDGNDELAFKLFKLSKYFKYTGSEFYVGATFFTHTIVTESEFIELLKNHKG